MSAAELNYLTATEMRRMLVARKISATELLELHLERVGSVNPSCNAVIALNEEGARESARAADDALARGTDLGPLHGLPMTIKDAFEVTGMATTCGLEALRDHRPMKDAVAVGRLRRSGAIIFGKTNLPAGAADHQSFNRLFGLTRNPWNPERTAGGSSGGSAAALAAGLTPMELGSDIGGSIRVPSHFCGVYGHKPSYGIVPVEGHIPPAPGQSSRPELGVAGPMARSAADLQLLFDVIQGASDFRAAGAELRLPPSRHDDLRAFRVAVWSDGKAYSLDSGYAAAIDAFVEDLRRCGVKVDTEARPAFDMAESFDIYLQALFGIIGRGLPQAEQEAILNAGSGAPADTYPRRIAQALQQSLPEYLLIAERRRKLFLAWRDFFTAYDVFLCPVTPTVAFPHDVARDDMVAQFERTIVVDGREVPYMDNLMWPGLVTVANLPATSIPTRHLVGGLPAGIQVVGPYLGDYTTLRFAQLVEQELGGFMKPAG